VVMKGDAPAGQASARRPPITNGTPVTDESFESALPDDLKSVADELRAERPDPSGDVLERVQKRVAAQQPARRRPRFLTPRAAAMAGATLAAAIATSLSGLNVPDAVAALVSSVTSPASSNPLTSAAETVYCGAGSGSGASGWAPTFRWHYGYPSPNTQGADDGWSASVQPTCPGGSLSIKWSDGNVSVLPGNSIKFGYDFHQANKPAFTMTASNLLVVWTYKCTSNGPTMTYSPATETWTQNTYHAPANDPDWIPTGTKTDAAGFQGSLTVPALCGAGKPVIFTGGTFSATIKIT
jgi:hypothetical protein